MRLFCFGTLMDEDIRRIVLGPHAAALPVEPARLPGYRRVCVPGESYPVAVPDRDAAIDGVLTPSLSAHHLDRVQFFEGFEFALAPCVVRAGETRIEALFCRATERLETTDVPWDFASWRSREKSRYLDAVEAYMQEFDRLGIEEAHAVWLAGQGRNAG